MLINLHGEHLSPRAAMNVILKKKRTKKEIELLEWLTKQAMIKSKEKTND